MSNVARLRTGNSHDVRGARAAQLEAQAKINLRLRILAREASGYHQLETLFLRIALSDTVRVRRTDGARALDVHGVDAAALGPVEKNLAWRAAVAYVEARDARDGFAIELEKRIPIGGGLGGGSADAGAVLRVLDAMSTSPLGEARLRQIATSLGADVPFLTSEHAYVLAWGRGERMLALAPPPARDVTLLVPAFGVNTADAYGWLASARATGAVLSDDSVLDARRLGDWSGIAEGAANDFEGVVAARHPLIAAGLRILREGGAAPALLSGSGSVMFGVWQARPASAVGVEGARAIATRTAVRVEPVSPLD